MAQVRDERSLGDLFSDLSRETTTLVRKEVQLAKAELGDPRPCEASHKDHRADDD